MTSPVPHFTLVACTRRVMSTRQAVLDDHYIRRRPQHYAPFQHRPARVLAPSQHCPREVEHARSSAAPAHPPRRPWRMGDLLQIVCPGDNFLLLFTQLLSLLDRRVHVLCPRARKRERRSGGRNAASHSGFTRDVAHSARARAAPCAPCALATAGPHHEASLLLEALDVDLGVQALVRRLCLLLVLRCRCTGRCQRAAASRAVRTRAWPRGEGARACVRSMRGGCRVPCVRAVPHPRAGRHPRAARPGWSSPRAWPPRGRALGAGRAGFGRHRLGVGRPCRGIADVRLVFFFPCTNFFHEPFCDSFPLPN